MTTSRSDRAPMTAAAARAEIAANAGGQFDPDVAAVVIELMDDGVLPRLAGFLAHRPLAPAR